MSEVNQPLAPKGVFFVPEADFVGSVGQQGFPASVSHRRLLRSEQRMNAAKSSVWAHRWAGVFVRYTRAERALRSVSGVRA